MMIELLQSVTILILGVGLILNALATRRLLSAVDNACKLAVLAVMLRGQR
jgi:hypothetical protein